MTLPASQLGRWSIVPKNTGETMLSCRPSSIRLRTRLRREFVYPWALNPSEASLPAAYFGSPVRVYSDLGSQPTTITCTSAGVFRLTSQDSSLPAL